MSNSSKYMEYQYKKQLYTDFNNNINQGINQGLSLYNPETDKTLFKDIKKLDEEYKPVINEYNNKKKIYQILLMDLNHLLLVEIQVMILLIIIIIKLVMIKNSTVKLLIFIKNLQFNYMIIIIMNYIYYQGWFFLD